MDRPSECASAVRCHALTVIVTDLVLTLVRERAVDGKVSLDDIDRICDLMRRGTIPLDQALKAHEESCRKHLLQPKGNVGARSNPFQRLMVRPFEQLLVGDPPALARPYLANYFDYLGHAFGKRLDHFERHCRGIVQALLVIHGNNLTWDHFYADPRTVKTLEAALKLMTHSLHTPEGQRTWYACMARPVGEHPTLPAGRVDEVMSMLQHTHRGLMAAD